MNKVVHIAAVAQVTQWDGLLHPPSIKVAFSQQEAIEFALSAFGPNVVIGDPRLKVHEVSVLEKHFRFYDEDNKKLIKTATVTARVALLT